MPLFGFARSEGGPEATSLQYKSLIFLFSEGKFCLSEVKEHYSQFLVTWLKLIRRNIEWYSLILQSPASKNRD